MMRYKHWKHWLLLLLAFSLMLALVPATLAQDAEGEDDATEQVEADEAAAEEGEEEGEGGSVLTPLGINGGLLFVQTFNFILIAVILTATLWRPAVNMLDARSEKIKKGLEDASAAARDRQNAEQEAERIRSEARTEAAQEISAARERGDEVAKGIEEEARKRAEQIVTDAEADAKAARDKELAGLRDQVMAISAAMAQRMVGESIDDDKQRELASNFFSALPEDAKALSGEVEVVSAMPLTDDEQTDAKQQLGTDNVTFTVDPTILGGVIVRSQERVIDGSVRSSLEDLTSRLN